MGAVTQKSNQGPGTSRTQKKMYDYQDRIYACQTTRMNSLLNYHVVPCSRSWLGSSSRSNETTLHKYYCIVLIDVDVDQPISVVVDGSGPFCRVRLPAVIDTSTILHVVPKQITDHWPALRHAQKKKTKKKKKKKTAPRIGQTNCKAPLAHRRLIPLLEPSNFGKLSDRLRRGRPSTINRRLGINIPYRVRYRQTAFGPLPVCI